MDEREIQERLERGLFELSRHALRRVVERDITEEEIRQAGGRAEIIEDYPLDKYSPSCLVLGCTDRGRPLHMQVCYTDSRTIKVITLYEPGVDDWKDFRTRSWL